MIVDIVNSITGIEKMSYLELGVASGATFEKIQAGKKVSVDSKTKADFHMTTDEFFDTWDARECFDMIYIDANHSLDFVYRDYQNSCEILCPGGYIFLHDLFPPSKEWTKKSLCGDCFQILPYLLQHNQDVFVMNGDCGLTLVYDALPLPVPVAYTRMTYFVFLGALKPVQLFSLLEMQRIVKRLSKKRR